MIPPIGIPIRDVQAQAYVRDDPEPAMISFSALRGRWVVLFFYPRDFTFICPTEIRAFASLEQQFAQEDAVLIGASTDSYFSHRAWFNTVHELADVAFPVIADTSHEVASAFGVLAPDGSTYRATFLIDPQGVLRHLLVNDIDHDGGGAGRNVHETLRTLQALRVGELCPAGWTPGGATLNGDRLPAVLA